MSLIPKYPSQNEIVALSHLVIEPSLGLVLGKRGRPIGKVDGHGYVRFETYVQGAPVRFKRANVIWWKYYGTWPSSMLDHIDRNRVNDIITNLRLSDSTRNNMNRTKSKFMLGVRFHDKPLTKQWEATITVDYKPQSLGYYVTELEAHNAYLNAKLKVINAKC